MSEISFQKVVRIEKNKTAGNYGVQNRNQKVKRAR